MTSETSATAALAFGPFVLDRAGGRLLQQGRPLELAPRPWAVLVYLAARPGQLVGKDELLDAVWGHRHVGDSVLKVTVNALRSTLGDDAKSPRWLHTVSRRGYRFSEAVHELAPTPDTQPATAAVEPALAAPAVRAPERRAGNLPVPGPALLGRAEALVAVKTALAAHRLVTITGPGGVGKTSLALQVAGFEAPPDGVWLLRLEPFSSAEAVTAALARTVGLAEAVGRSTDMLARALATLRLRLVLDNAEHLVDVLAAPLAAWLTAAPGLQVLVTSQRSLNISGERRLPLRPLALTAAPPSDGSEPSDDAANSPAVCLLLQRVRALDPDWRPDAAALRDAVVIARELDGLPLALELAAVRVPLLGMEGVRQRLAARLKLLTHGHTDAPDRQRTLRAALEWSIGLLPPLAAAVLERLSVFAASFTLDAAQAVAAAAGDGVDEMELLDAIELLRDMALLVHADGGASPQGRLRLYDSVRLLAAERLAGRGDDGAARQALRRWLIGHFGQAFDRLVSVSQSSFLSPLQTEAEHLQVAMAAGLADLQANPQPGLLAELAELGSVSVAFCCRAGLKHVSAAWLAGLRAVEASMSEFPIAGDTLLAMDVHTAILASMGMLLVPAQGLAAAERAWPVLRSRGLTRRTLCLQYYAGILTFRVARHDRLAQLIVELRATEPPDANLYERRLSGWLEALQANVAGQVEVYKRFCAQTLAQSRERGDGPEGWAAAMGLAQALYQTDQVDEAVTVLDGAVDDIRACGRLRLQGALLAQAVVLRLTRDAGPETLQRLREAVQVLKAEAMVWWLADALAWVPLWEGRTDDARRVQAWADGLVAARGENRGPVFSRVRAEWARRMGSDIPLDAPPLDEDAALRLARALPDLDA